MNTFVKALTGTIIMAFVFFSCVAGANAAAITKNLEDDTRIIPPGVVASQWWNNMPEFKKGTVVTLNEYGEVLEGTLASDAKLPCVSGSSFYYQDYYASENAITPNRFLTFKSGTKVIFNDKGEVIKGTVSGTFVDIPISQTSYIGVQDGTEISFRENGTIAACTSSNDIYLRPVGWFQILNENNTNKIICSGLVQFKKGTPLELNDKYEVVKGTLNKDTKLLSPDGIKVYQAGTIVEFGDNGVVVKAVTPQAS